MRRISNRRYPARKCKNPTCKVSFEPHDRRQEYCERQCQINANNDKRFLANNSRFIDEKQARRNNKILESFWEKLKDKKQKLVSKGLLEWEQFKFNSQTLINRNSKSGKNILWYYDYGLEQVDEPRGLYEIHKKI